MDLVECVRENREHQPDYPGGSGHEKVEDPWPNECKLTVVLSERLQARKTKGRTETKLKHYRAADSGIKRSVASFMWATPSFCIW